MANSSSWSDAGSHIAVIQAAGGLNKPLLIKGSGTGGLMFFQPTPAAINATATATVAEFRAGIITSTTASAVALTMPTVVSLAANINGGAAARNGTQLQVGSAYDVAIIVTGATNAVTLTTNTGWTIVGEAVILADTSSIYRVRFTDVTVGAETASIFNLATSA